MSSSNDVFRLIRSVRAGIGLVLGVVAFAISGCCTPIGPGCGTGNCYDCDGTGGRPIPTGPIQALKQQLTCGGGGCGEVYRGEWISTPPDCVDPCCDDQFVGGAYPARPFCGTLASLFTPGRFSGRFEGGRDCGCCESCGDTCDSCGAGEFVDEGYIDGEYIEGNSMEVPAVEHSRGCATCANRRVQGGVAGAIRAPQSNQTTQAQTRSTNLNQKPRVRGQVRTAANPPQSLSRPNTQMRSPIPKPTRTPSTSQRSVAPQSAGMVRLASATSRQQAPVRAAYAPRNGANRNRVIE